MVIAGAMWAVSLDDPSFNLRNPIRIVVAIAIALVGAGIDICSAISFRRAKTMVNPMKPENASALVTSGPYKFSRNPMYVGLVFILFAWALFLGSPKALAWPLFFVFYLNRFQIAPEERVLAAIFGVACSEYNRSLTANRIFSQKNK